MSLNNIGTSISKIIFTIFLSYLGYILITTKIYTWTILDFANALIHEVGHLIFYPLYTLPFIGHTFGKFMWILGGSLTQVLVPIFIVIYFFYYRKWYSSFFGLFWLGDNLIMNHFYIADARCMCIPTTSFGGDGGIIHDWNYILSSLDILKFDLIIAQIENILGVIVILIALTLMVTNIITEFSLRNQN